MPLLTRDRALALATLLLVAILAVEARDLPGPSRWQAYGSDFFPKLLLALLGGLALVLLVRTLLPAGRAQPALWPALAGFVRQNPRILAVLALFGLYVWALPLVGFRLATAVYLFVSFGVLTGFRSLRTVAISAVVAVAMTLLVYALFQYGLRLRLP